MIWVPVKQVGEILQLGHLLEARVGDLGVVQGKLFELLQLGHVLEARVGDFGFDSSQGRLISSTMGSAMVPSLVESLCKVLQLSRSPKGLHPQWGDRLTTATIITRICFMATSLEVQPLSFGRLALPCKRLTGED